MFLEKVVIYNITSNHIISGHKVQLNRSTFPLLSQEKSVCLQRVLVFNEFEFFKYSQQISKVSEWNF